MPDRDPLVEGHFELARYLLALSGVHLPHKAQVGELVRGEDCDCVDTRRFDGLAEDALALNVGVDLLVVSHHGDEQRDAIAEFAPDRGLLDVGVLDDVVKQAGREHVLAEPRLRERLRNRKRVAYVRGPVLSNLARVGRARELERTRQQVGGLQPVGYGSTSDCSYLLHPRHTIPNSRGFQPFSA